MRDFVLQLLPLRRGPNAVVTGLVTAAPKGTQQLGAPSATWWETGAQQDAPRGLAAATIPLRSSSAGAQQETAPREPWSCHQSANLLLAGLIQGKKTPGVVV